MEPIPRTHQITCVVNKKKLPAILMNAVGHMSAGLVNIYRSDTSLMRFRDFFDKDGTVHPATSENGLIILRSENSNQIRSLRKNLIEAKIPYTDFTETMVNGNYVTQQEEFDGKPEIELEYIGVCFFLEIERSRALTRRFSLYTNSEPG
jgi:Protein of unknown function (DUF2000)